MQKGKRSHHVYILIGIVIFALMACVNDSGRNNDDEDNDTVLETIRSGPWSGIAGFGEVEFVVTPDSTGIESFKVIFSDFICGPVTHGGSITLSYASAKEIDNRSIDFDITLGGIQSSDYIVIEGTFDAGGDTISGTFELDNGDAVCSGSWDAQPD
jgi:hypothetical protein